MITLVTGSTGLLGNNVVRLLLERGETVRVLARSESDPRPLAGLDVEVVHGDLRDAAAVRAACAGVQAVVHSAAAVHFGWSHLEEMRAANVAGTRNVTEGALSAGARLVHVSTCDTMAPGAPGAPANEDTPGEKPPVTYVVTKRDAEQVVREYVDRGLNTVIVNPGFLLGPWDWKPSSGRMLLEVAKRFTPAAPPGGTSFADVRDVAAGVLAARDRGAIGRRYILAGHNESLFNAWKLFARVSGGSPPLYAAHGPAPKILGLLGDLWGKISGHEPVVNSAAVKIASLYHYYDSGRAERELGYSVRPFEESARDAWNWFKQHGYA